MDYYEKYLKYKSKYNKLKNKYSISKNYISGNIDNKTYIDFITKESVEKININDDKNIMTQEKVK